MYQRHLGGFPPRPILKLLRVEAFFRGGIEAEREERKLWKKEQEEEHWRNHIAFKDMLAKYKQEATDEQSAT
jgi:hypothetical protein